MPIAQPHFQRPADVIAFVRECVDQADSTRLSEACNTPIPQFWRDRILEDLATIHRESSLETVFMNRDDFPVDAEEWKLGGHSIPTRHLHLALMRDDNGWRLSKI